MQEDSQTEDCKRTVSHITGVLEAKTKENAAKKIHRGKKNHTTFWTRTELSMLKGTQASSSMKENRSMPRSIFMKF